MGEARVAMVRTAGADRSDSGDVGAVGGGVPGRPLPWWLSLLAAVGAGLALLVSFPPYGRWWLAPVGVALFAVAVHRRRPLAGFGYGALSGAVFFVPLLSWTNLHLSNLPWLLLSGLESAYLGLLGAVAAYVSPVVDRARWSWPAVTGVLWVAQEALRDRTPFGGFPWGRLAFSQDESPLLRLAAVGGAPLVTFAVAVAGGFVVAALWRSWRPVGRAALVPVVAGLGGAVAVVGAGFVVPVGGTPTTGTAVVAVVQGNVPRMGFDFNAQRRAVLDNHVNGTVELARRVAAGEQEQPDLVVWPENSSDIDPLRNADAAARISVAADAIGAPILVGAVLRGPEPGQVRNVGLVWLPGVGVDRERMYVKRHPVPFAEYVPLRDIARMVSKEVDRVASDFVPGSEPGVLPLGPAVVGDVICFEVAYDGIVRDTVVGGAQLLVVQTNNATFNEAEARQQLAMVRLRAVEHGRQALMASTVGVSGFVGVDGRVFQGTGFNTAEVIVRELELREGRTVATRVGLWPEVLLVVGAGAVVAVAAVWRRRARPAGAGTAVVAGAGEDTEER
ncbi:apolipoprotein N-acyltransferase [Polymorphospora sp. NPDC050346]|uniref:apolipoprotein N-acyltransferase n=1 Tax=Polymorphospora sp. NPDC050346 TaxID=3155780 RepID=UPI0033F7B072